MIKRVDIDNNNYYICGIKKIKLDEESIICSDSNNNIRLFNI